MINDWSKIDRKEFWELKYSQKGIMEVEFYKTVEGVEPAGQFINSIEDVKLRAKIIRTV